MRKILLFMALVTAPLAAMAEGAGGSLLSTFDAHLKSLGCYRVLFGVRADGYESTGEYVVDGSDFYVASDGVEVYVEKGVKYQVNGAGREVVVDTAASLGNDIISNPAMGFASLAESLVATDLVVGGRQAVRLTPKQGSTAAETITIEADKSGRVPSRITYAADGGSIIIDIKSVDLCHDGLPRFDASKYVDFETVDMR
ncbi:MAG: hypothetical protein IJ348_05945 [Alistipes sp.]|nr:hypothetical protein [Alistipes sp.]